MYASRALIVYAFCTEFAIKVGHTGKFALSILESEMFGTEIVAAYINQSLGVLNTCLCP